MNLLELLHSENVVRYLEKIDNDLKELLESNIDDIGLSLKFVLMIETLLNKYGSKNGHIGEYFERYSNIQNEIDSVNENIDELKLKILESNYHIDDLNEKIKAGGYSIDMNTFEGTVFEKLRVELIENKKLNYKYGKQ